MDRPRSVGIAWYARADYPGILKIMEDAGRLPETYEQWLVSAEQVEETVRGTGIAVIRAAIDPHAFTEWCAARELKRDGAARARFATEEAERSGG